MTEASANALAKVTPEKQHRSGRSPEMKGWLLKWTNYIKGYQRRWFVLSEGVLSYYRNRAEINHTCRGTISLHGALIHAVDSCTFVISNGGTQTFHIKAANEVERQSWVTALELAKAKAIRAIENEEEEEEETAQLVPSQEVNTVVRDLTERLENLRTCYDLILKHGVALQRALTDLETNEEEALASRTKIVNERATLFRITSKAMTNACTDYLRTAESQCHKWSKMLQHEREQRQKLEEMVEQLAKQHTQLEQAAHLVQHNKNVQGQSVVNSTANAVSSPTALTSDDENEFFDAEGSSCYEEENACYVKDSPQDTEDVRFIMNLLGRSSQDQTNNSSSSENEENKKPPESQLLPQQKANNSNSSENEEYQKPPEAQSLSQLESSQQNIVMSTSKSRGSSKKKSADLVDRATPSNENLSNSLALLPTSTGKTAAKKRRTRVPDKPNYPLNLWSIMKNCIGKELSKIPMPVNFNEPLSMLQRLTEDYEYAELLDAASQTNDECEQLAYVAAFTISSYSTTANRTGKPFNPLLGETFECDCRDDMGWRCIAEQVSHHPPMAAIHCEGRKWTCWQEFTMTSKFRGKYLQVIPLGSAYAHFHATDHKYTWRKVTTTVNNIIVGKLWVDQHGEMEITGLKAAAGLKCVLKYIPYSYFSRETQRRVKGVIMNRNNEVKWVLRGTWDSQIEIAPVLSTSHSGSNSDHSVYKTGAYKTVWNRRMPALDSDKYYNFTLLASQLNEMEEGVAPTDSRLRPDQRLMEEGRWDESNIEKVRLEDKQRQKRRERENEAEAFAEMGRPYPPYKPMWFERVREEGTDNVVHICNGKYWEHKRDQNWSQCPDLF